MTAVCLSERSEDSNKFNRTPMKNQTISGNEKVQKIIKSE
jgi:hypothetical protein